MTKKTPPNKFEIPAKKASGGKEPGDVLPRLCRLSRNDRNDQYGFDFKTLKSDGMHVAKNVRDGLPAAVAGLREGDYILEVNGESIDGIEHEQVVKKISARPTMVDLLAVNDLNAYLNHRNYMKSQDELDVGIRFNNDFNREDVTYHKLKVCNKTVGLTELFLNKRNES